MNKETIAEVIALLNTANYDTDTLNHKRDELVNTLKKQLSIYNVSKSFALGENVKVDRCIHGHEFELGQVVTIVEYEPSQTTSWLCSDGRNQWWLSEDEGNVL